MKFANPYWSEKLKMSALQRWLIVHSILYYEMNDSVVSDKTFDANAKQLVKMQKENPEEAKETTYWYMFYDFDGSTGFDLYDRLSNKDKKYLMHIASLVLKLSRGEVGSNEKNKSKRR